MSLVTSIFSSILITDSSFALDTWSERLRQENVRLVSNCGIVSTREISRIYICCTLPDSLEQVTKVSFFAPDVRK